MTSSVFPQPSPLLNACLWGNADLNWSKQIESLDENQWLDLVRDAEAHGVSGLLEQTLNEQNVTPFDSAKKQLLSLNARHRLKSLARYETLFLINDLFEQNKIGNLPFNFLLLKGMALRGLLYAHDALRPMSDVDLLMPKEQVQAAQDLLLQNGFYTVGHPSDAMHRHHHLPALMRSANGQTVVIELHSNALSGDVKESISTSNLISETQTVKLNGHTFKTPGHIDMLRHLCRHTFEPAENIRLVSTADIVRYAVRFAREIDWQTLRLRHSFVLNTLSCLHYVSPLPAALSEFKPAAHVVVPGGVGESIIKPVSVFDKTQNRKSSLIKLLNPPHWWMHVFYNRAPGDSLVLVRWLKHPLTISKWLARRLTAVAANKIASLRMLGAVIGKKEVTQ